MTDLEQINRTLHQIDQKLNKIESYLYNDDATDSLGLVNQVRDHSDRIDRIEEEGRVRKRVMAGIGMIAGFIGMAVVEIIKWLFTQK